MPTLKIVNKKDRFSLPLPHVIWINGRQLGVMNTPEISIDLPQGDFLLKIQSVFPFFFATKFIKIKPDVLNVVTFQSREKWWDILFTIDLLFWIAELFFELPHPWNLVYKIITNGYFIIWLIYEFVIREKYYKIDSYSTILDSQEKIKAEN